MGLGAGRRGVVAFAGRIVELGLLRADDHVVRRPLPEVDARLGDGRRARDRLRRQVPDEQPRLALVGHLVDRHHRRADPVGVDDPLVDPARGARVLVDGQLARGQHDLALDVVDDVPVRVDVVEGVVAAHRLELVEGVLQGPVVPQAGVPERVLLAVDERLGDRFVAAERAVLPAAEVERDPRHRDVVRDVALLLDELVRLDGEALDGLGIEPPDDDRGQEPDAERQPEWPDLPGERPTDEEGGRQPGDDGQEVEREELGVLVRVADARRDAPGAVHELVLVELVAEGDRQQEQATEHGQVHPDRGGEDEPATGRADDVADEDDDQRRDDEAVEQALDQAQERQLEQEEADVPAEDRIDDGLSAVRGEGRPASTRA